MGSAGSLDLCLSTRTEGAAASGSVTDVFNFINDSESEIDFEYQGQTPSALEMTNFSTFPKVRARDSGARS